MQPVTVFVADHHPLFRHGLFAILNLYPEFRVVGDSPTLTQAVKKIKTLHPDIVLIDNHLSDGDGVTGTLAIKQTSPCTRVIILAETGNEENLIDAIQAGAKGYLVKGKANITEIIESIKLVSRGNVSVSPRKAPVLVDYFREGMTDTVKPRT
jgi:two-component system, NarL family, nitrate/nitrite response regulator NarL